jgi:hypothetical protein
MSHITDKANAGRINLSEPTTLLRTHSHRTHPDSSVSVAEIALESLSSPPPFGGVVGLLKIKSSQCLEQFNLK